MTFTLMLLVALGAPEQYVERAVAFLAREVLLGPPIINVIPVTTTAMLRARCSPRFGTDTMFPKRRSTIPSRG